MTNVNIAKLRRRYRLPADAVNARARVDRVFNAALADDLFDAALERAGISAGGEVCIRRVESRVRLNSDADDAKLAVECSVALADAIAAELANGGANVVRFSSRRQALVDMSLSVARGNLERAWAWRRVDLWRTDVFDSLRDAEREVFLALARYPVDATHVLVMLADANLLQTYVANVPESFWNALAKAVLIEWNGLAELPEGPSEPPRGLSDWWTDDALNEATPTVEDHGLPEWRDAICARIRRTSRMLCADFFAGYRLSPTLNRVLASIALVECEPAVVATSRGPEVVRALAQRLHDEQIQRATSALKPEPARSTKSDDAADTRLHLNTQFGGLLFLLHAVRALDLPRLIANSNDFVSHSPRWVLHELAVLLLQRAFGDAYDSETLRADASTFIFAGIVAGNTREGTFHGLRAVDDVASEPTATTAERATLDRFANDIAAYVRARGGALADESDTALLRRVIERPAEILVDAAWIEAHFSVNNTSTHIRRAGLDLDLGWLPWIAMIVRFVYA